MKQQLLSAFNKFMSALLDALSSGGDVTIDGVSVVVRPVPGSVVDVDIANRKYNLLDLHERTDAAIASCAARGLLGRSFVRAGKLMQMRLAERASKKAARTASAKDVLRELWKDPEDVEILWELHRPEAKRPSIAKAVQRGRRGALSDPDWELAQQLAKLLAAAKEQRGI